MKLRPTKKKKLNDNEIAVSDSDVNKSTNTHNESDEQPQVTEQPDASEGNEESQSIPVSADQQKLESTEILHCPLRHQVVLLPEVVHQIHYECLYFC